GGSNQPGLYLRASIIDLTSASSPSTVIADGAGNTLLGNASPNLTLDVQAGNSQGSANVTINGNVSNAGTILLDVHTAGGFASSIGISGGATLTNAAGGIIRTTANTSPGDSRRIIGNGPTNGTFVNSGTVDVAGGNLD